MPASVHIQGLMLRKLLSADGLWFTSLCSLPLCLSPCCSWIERSWSTREVWSKRICGVQSREKEPWRNWGRLTKDGDIWTETWRIIGILVLVGCRKQKLLYFKQKEVERRVLGVYKIIGRAEGAGLRLGLQEWLPEYYRTDQPGGCYLGHFRKALW